MHDTDTSRSIPWARRARAAQLLAELYSPDRRWDGIVVGEPQRAFGSAMQVQLILPQLADAGASLWCPEVGGPVDPTSEAHDIVLNLFGGLSKAERRRLQTRCAYRSHYPGDNDHPRSLAVAEARILPVLDEWLGRQRNISAA